MEIRRKEALQHLVNNGFSKEQARFVYTKMKNALRNAGLRGNDLRQSARRNLIRSTESLPVEKPRFKQLDRVSSPIITPKTAVQLNPQKNIEVKISVNPNTSPTFEGSFSSAFGKARKGGYKTFFWNGREYSTELAEQKTPKAEVDVQAILDKARNEEVGMLAKVQDINTKVNERSSSKEYENSKPYGFTFKPEFTKHVEIKAPETQFETVLEMAAKD